MIADTREQVAELNAAVQEQSQHDEATGWQITTTAGDRIGLGDRVATRRNDPELQVANRQTWTVTGIDEDGNLRLHGRGRDREVPATYATRFVELAYATTAHGAQGATVGSARVAMSEHTGAASAYVAMTRGRESNVAHLIAESVEEARKQWVEVFSRNRADLGPAHARRQAIDAIERYGGQTPRRPTPMAPTHSLPARDHGLSI